MTASVTESMLSTAGACHSSESVRKDHRAWLIAESRSSTGTGVCADQ